MGDSGMITDNEPKEHRRYVRRKLPKSRLRKKTHRLPAIRRIVEGVWTVKVATRAPRIYGECKEFVGDGPCPFVSCRYHLAIEINDDSGSITHVWGADAEIIDLAHTCALRQAARGGMTLHEVGERLNISRERARQIEETALEKLMDNCGADLREMLRTIKEARRIEDARIARSYRAQFGW
jgi:hypothetical protein